MYPTVLRLSRSSSIGWIGLGAMGHPMALNLFTKTYLAAKSSPHHPHPSDVPRFFVCEQDNGRVDSFINDLRERGGQAMVDTVSRVGNGREMALEASKILTMLPSTPQVEAVYLDPETGILAGLEELPKNSPVLSPEPFSDTVLTPTSELPPEESSSSHTPHTLLIDQTTLDPTAARRIANIVMTATHGRAWMLDAPVSGGTKAAAAGLLTIMLGSPSIAATALALPLLLRMARHGGVIECGDNGTGVGVKVCNNLILAINQVALAEGLALGNSLGISPLLLHNVINTSSGQSWSSSLNSPLSEVEGSPGSRGYQGGFQSRLMLKDVGLALHAAHEHSLPTPLAWAARSVYDSVCNEPDMDWATKDFSVVFEWLRKKQSEGVEQGWKEGNIGK